MDKRASRSGPAVAVLLAGTACGLLSWWTSDAEPWSTVWYSVGGFGAATVAVVGLRWHRPRPAWPWLLIALGLLCVAVGDVLWDLTELLRDAPGYTNLLANLAYLASYPCFALAVFGMLGRRWSRADALVLLEAAAVAVAAWLTLWVLFVHPDLAHQGLGFWDWLPTVLYPPLDLVLVVALWRLGRGDVRTSPAWRFLIGGFVTMLAADLGYAILQMPEYDLAGWLLNVGWMVSYAAIAAAAIHPEMPYLQGAPERGTEELRTRVFVTGLACLTPFVLRLVAPVQVGAVSRLVALSGCVIIVLSLIRVRIATERNRVAAERLVRDATHDPLTGLANRAALLDELLLAARRGARRHDVCAVVFIDLDEFKAVNDALGHRYGDVLLREVAERLRMSTRADECVARLGGDEFVVVLEGLTGTSDALEGAQRIVDAVAAPYTLDGSEFFVHASAGVVAHVERYGDAVEDALRDADLAMYRAKSSSREHVCLFEPEFHQQALEHVARRRALRHAIAGNELFLRYQPIYDAETGRQLLTEALLRWEHDGESVPPDVFVPLAEASGDIVAIGEWVLGRAVADLVSGRWSSDLSLSVNVSVRQLVEPEFATRAVEIVDAAGIVPARIVLELTESVLLEPDPTVDANLARLRAAGFRLAVDDFGIGYSNLAALKRLAVDWLKIDRLFVAGLDSPDPAESAHAQSLVRMVVRLARELGARVVAEGVETPDQLARLRDLRCDALQGFLLAEPGPAPEWRVPGDAGRVPVSVA